MRQHPPFSWRAQRPLHAIALAIWVFSLAAPAQAGTQIAPTESSDIGAPIEVNSWPESDMALDPIRPEPLQRIDPQDPDTASDLAALKRIADSPAVRTQLKSKRFPKGSTYLSAGNAAWTLGLVYLHGAGVPQDTGQAHLWFKRALALGARQALAGMAWCAIEGCEGLPQPSEADQWTRQLRTVNRPLALYLEWLALDRLSPMRSARPDLQNGDLEPPLIAPQLLLSAARAGNIHALIELGLNAAAAQQPDKALKYFQRAADDSEVAAANAAIVAQNEPPRSAPRSDANKVALELLSQAQRFHRGEGVPVNYAEAIRLYRLAESKGSVEAGRMLALIYSRPLAGGNVDVAWISQLSELDLTRSTPGLRIKAAPRQLQRERTALIDLLPEKWRARIL